jgi:hypothetical protein
MMRGPGPPAESETAQNALLPRSLFSDEVKPGDTITLKVSAVYGDEVEVAATATPGPETEEPEMEEAGEMEEQPPMMSADDEIEAAAEQV